MNYNYKIDVGEVSAFVERHYGFQAKISSVRSGYMSTTLKLKNGSQQYLLKVYRRSEVNYEKISFGISASFYLKRKGLPTNELICSLYGKVLVCEGENLFLLGKFIHGDCFQPGNRDQLHAAGSMLGRVHRVGRDMNIFNRQLWKPMWNERIGGLERILKKLERISKLKNDVVQCRVRLARLEKEVAGETLDAMPTSLIHGDYRAQNLIYNNALISGVLDFDMARPAQRIFDLAYAMMFFQAVVSVCPLSNEELEVFFNAYDMEAGLVSVERAFLPVFMELSLLQGMTLWMEIGYLKKVNTKAVNWLKDYKPMLVWIDQDGKNFMQKVCN